MFGGNAYWWVSVLTFLLFVGLNVVIFLLRNDPKLSYRIAYGVACFLLIYKTVEYICWQAVGEHLKIPVEFSAVSYFLFAVTVVFRIKKLDSLGAFCGFLAGMCYSVASWVSPNSFVESAYKEPMFFFVMAIINHHALYFGAMLMIANVRRFDPKKFYFMLIGIAIMLGYTWIIYLFTPYAELYGKMIFIRICDGSILTFLFPSMTLNIGLQIGYLVVVGVLFCLLLFAFYALNGYLAKKRAKRTGYELDIPPAIFTLSLRGAH